jgi:hypothetical protein
MAMMDMRNSIRLIAAAVVAATSVSCGSVVRDGGSPVYLVIDSLSATRGGAGSTAPSNFLLSDVVTNVTSPAPCSVISPCATIFDDPGSVVLRAPLRDVGNATPLSATTNNEVTINRIHIEYTRADGRNVQGVDVPFAFDAAATGTIPANGTLQLGFELVRHVAKQESPLAQLRTSSNVINTITKVTFYGQDRVGNAVSVTGQLQVNFGNFGDQ